MSIIPRRLQDKHCFVQCPPEHCDCINGNRREWELQQALAAAPSAPEQPAQEGLMDEHEAFEKWYLQKIGIDIKPVRQKSDGNYGDPFASGFWGCWQARALLASQPAAPTVPADVNPMEAAGLMNRAANYIRQFYLPSDHQWETAERLDQIANLFYQAGISNRSAAPIAMQDDAVDARTEQIRSSHANVDSKGKIQLRHEVECLLSHIALLKSTQPSAAPVVPCKSIDSGNFTKLLNAYAQAPFGQDDAPYQAIVAYVHDWASSSAAPIVVQDDAVPFKGHIVSIDVSAGDATAGHRIFAELTGEVGSDCKTMLAVERSRNFAAPVEAAAAGQDEPVAYTSKEKLNNVKTLHEAVETMWSLDIKAHDDVALYTRQQPAQAASPAIASLQRSLCKASDDFKAIIDALGMTNDDPNLEEIVTMITALTLEAKDSSPAQAVALTEGQLNTIRLAAEICEGNDCEDTAGDLRAIITAERGDA